MRCEFIATEFSEVQFGLLAGSCLVCWLGSHNAAESGMEGTAILFSLHSGTDSVANAVLIAAHKTSPALNSFNDAGFLWVEAAFGSGGISLRAIKVVVGLVVVVAPFPNISRHVV